MHAALRWPCASGRVEPESGVVFASCFGCKFRRRALQHFTKAAVSSICFARHDNLLQKAALFGSDLVQLRKQSVADDRDTCPRVVHDVFVFMWAQLGIDRDRDSTDFDNSEK